MSKNSLHDCFVESLKCLQIKWQEKKYGVESVMERRGRGGERRGEESERRGEERRVREEEGRRERERRRGRRQW